jgi:cellulose synthase (UDP-forming)
VNRNSLRAVSVLSLTLFVILTAGRGFAEAGSLTFAPSADAYVTVNSPTKNFGTDKSLRVDTTPITISFIKFTVSGVSGTPQKAVLKVRNTKASALGYELSAVIDTSWSQGSLTYASAPSPGKALAVSGPTTSGSWTSLDVSSTVTSNGTFGFALVGLSGTATAIGSSESSSPPQLIIENVTTSTSTIIPTGFKKSLGAYDLAGSLAGLQTLTYDHYFVSWDLSTQWIAGINQHQALLQDLAGSRLRNRQPVVTLEPWAVSGLSSSTLLQDVIAGKYDANINWACADLATFAGPVVVRWGHEMENLTGRYPWATSNTAAYVNAYRYFVDKCRILAPNIKFMWSPTGNRNLGGYWPGSSYADYVGVSVYDYPEWEMSYYGHNRSFHENFSERYNYVVAYGKPLYIAEFSATGATQVQWLSDALVDMGNFPLLQTAIFFNAKDPVGWGSLPAPDWRVDPALLTPAN